MSTNLQQKPGTEEKYKELKRGNIASNLGPVVGWDKESNVSFMTGITE